MVQEHPRAQICCVALSRLVISPLAHACPVFYAYALVTMDQAWLFVDDSRFDPGVREQLSAAVEVLPYESFFSRLPGILDAGTPDGATHALRHYPACPTHVPMRTDPALKNLPIFLARRCSHAVVEDVEHNREIH